MPLPPGLRIGVYEVIGLLGAGGMGACGRRAERVRESRLGRAWGWGPTRI